MGDDNIRALGRGLDVLEYLSMSGGARRNELTKRFGLSRPAIFRILQTLHQCGLVSEGRDEVYRPTLAVHGLSDGLSDQAWAIWAAQPTLLELQKEVTWTCELSTYENYAMVQRETTHTLNPYCIEIELDVRRSMLFSAAGRAYLAFCPPAEAAAILEHLERHGDPVNPSARCTPEFYEFVDAARLNGFATERRQTYPNAAAIAAPVRRGGRVLACLSIIWIAKAVPFREGVESLAPALLRARASIEAAMIGDGDLASDGRLAPGCG
jgi:IclR family mhp operon transcriptional activator